MNSIVRNTRLMHPTYVDPSSTVSIFDWKSASNYSIVYFVWSASHTE